jgi:hypothetical protein
MREIARRTCGVFLPTLIAVSCVAATANAEPLTIRSGSLTLYWDASATPFMFVGDGFSVGGGEPGISAPAGAMVGSVVDLSRTVTSGFGSGPATVGSFSGEAFFDGSLQFVAAPFVAPSSSASSVTFQTGFTMTGMLLGYATAARTGTPLFALDLTGGGTAMWGPLRNIGDQYILNTGGLTFNFEDQAPVPEPASMLLFGTGAALAALRRHTKKRR